MEEIYIKNLIDSMQGNINEVEWNDNDPVTLQDIEKAFKNNLPYESSPFGDTGKYLPLEYKDNNYHIARVLYFVKHPEEIHGIHLDNACHYSYIRPIPVLVDGWHRLMAGKYIGLEKIKVNYGGRSDVLEYLKGNCELPLE